MMYGHGYGTLDWTAWLGMGLMMLLWTGIIVGLTVWAVATRRPGPARDASPDQREAASGRR